ncbi:class I SAM-dependent methyltransferase [Rhizobium sp. BK538]|uniref:class I SAM-dependent methyltransferase n=1 Tax=Rhizobium sp. BK538 TaxID=2586984 RepID=UPI001612E164|nr:class I SAM-dependent methyltransferase [Rhizobium sp. BK538]MBB4172074.1 hypothetical protein [Rhizobium sp. BK538]
MFVDKILKKVRVQFAKDNWFETVCESYSNPPVIFRGTKLPAFPPDIVQINSTGQAGKRTLEEAFVFYEDCVRTFARHGSAIKSSDRLLDFGVGWGRIARFFLKELPLENIHGLDVVEESIEICRETFGSDNFSVTSPFPPTGLQSASFSHIVGYSVFSHLSEEACSAWMEEFHRILAPGGVVALTTRGRPFFDFCVSLRGKNHPGYLGALANIFDDFGAARSQYDRGAFVHSNRNGVNGGGAMTADFYGETFIPEKYAEQAYARWFDLLEFQYDASRQTHPIMFFKKK